MRLTGGHLVARMAALLEKLMKALKFLSLAALTLLPLSLALAQPIQCSISLLDSNTVLVSWNSVPGKHYDILGTTNLSGGWQNVFTPPETFTAATTTLERSVPLAGGARFFRVAMLDTSNTPVNMAFIPAGSFTMGDTFGEGESDERPTHSVYASAFYMDRYEVTKTLWDEVYQWATNHGYTFDNAGSGKAADHPVQEICWYDMVKWCNARSEKEYRTPAYYTEAAQTNVCRTGTNALLNDWVKWTTGYRLPTEAEWEKAARGGLSGKRFPWGDTISHSQANYFSTTNDAYDISVTRGNHPAYDTGGLPYTAPVGSFAPNGYGVYDMTGNVWELCWDWYGSTYYGSSPAFDPRGLSPDQKECDVAAVGGIIARVTIAGCLLVFPARRTG